MSDSGNFHDQEEESETAVRIIPIKTVVLKFSNMNRITVFQNFKCFYTGILSILLFQVNTAKRRGRGRKRTPSKFTSKVTRSFKRFLW